MLLFYLLEPAWPLSSDLKAFSPPNAPLHLKILICQQFLKYSDQAIWHQLMVQKSKKTNKKKTQTKKLHGKETRDASEKIIEYSLLHNKCSKANQETVSNDEVPWVRYREKGQKKLSEN